MTGCSFFSDCEKCLCKIDCKTAKKYSELQIRLKECEDALHNTLGRAICSINKLNRHYKITTPNCKDFDDYVEEYKKKSQQYFDKHKDKN